VLALTRGDKDTVLAVTVPLNVLIGQGLGLGLNNEKLRRYPFTTCLETGCIARIPVDDALLDQLRQEPRVRLRFAAPDGRMMGVAFPLDGFARADGAARRSERLFW
jgi:invasion protein IalB